MCTEHKKITRRIISLLLSVILIFPILTLVISAGDADLDAVNKVEVDHARFSSSELTIENADVKVNTDGTVKLTANGPSSKISMEIDPITAETKANALRIVIKNSSNFEMMNVEYIYKNSAQISVPGTKSVALKDDGEAVEYIIPVEYADSMTHLVLDFSSSEKSTGGITLISIGAISYRYDNRKYVGVMTENNYDEVSRSAKFSGSVSYETALANPDAQIVLYRLGQNETIEDVSFVHSYVANLPMTLSFSFTWEIKNTADRCSRYFAAILTKDNEILPLTPEIYLNNEGKNDYNQDQSDAFFKGIETTLYAGAAENGTSVAFVDVYLNKLESQEGDGFQYLLDDGKKYYFDRIYVSELDAVMKSYSLSGTSVYLRFLVDSYDESFGSAIKSEGVENKKYFAINPSSDEVIENIYACSDFVVSRYASAEFGALKGVVIGRSLNNSEVYNYCDPMPMSDYSDMIARVYMIVKNTLDKNAKNLEILLPMSDSMIGETLLVDANFRDKHYPSNLLAESIVESIGRYGVNLDQLCFVLESEQLPNCLTPSSSKGKFINADNLNLFINAIKKISDKYSKLSSEIMFCWFPYDEISSYELLTTYMYNYNVLACAPGIRGYVLSVFEFGDTSDSDFIMTEKGVYSTIKSTYKYADTYNNPGVSKTALDATGKKKWSDVVKNYDPEKVIKRNLLEVNAEYFIPEDVIGTYKMWDFSSATGQSSWRVYDGCETLSVYTPSSSLQRALVASFGGDAFDKYGADYGSFIYRPDEALLMRNISNISFDFIIPSELSKNLNSGEMFEVKITISSGDSIIENTGVLKSDTKANMCIDLAEIEKIEYIKVSLRSLDGESCSGVKLCVNSISIHSKVYDDKELEKIVLSGELTNSGDIGDASEIDALTVVLTIAVISIFAVVFGWCVFALKTRKRKE